MTQQLKGNTRRRVISATVGLTGAALAACGAGGTPSTSATAEVGGTLEYATWASAAELEFKSTVGKLFMGKHPKTTVNVVVQQGQGAGLGTYAAYIASLSAAGTPPDALDINNDQVAQFATQKLSEPLDPFMSKDKTAIADYYPAALKAYQFQGKQIAMPNGNNPVGVFVNRTLFEEAGVPLPPRSYKDTKWSHDDLLEAAKKLTRTNRAGQQQWGFAVDTWIGRWFPFLWGNGGDVFDNPQDPKKFTWNSKETEQTLQFLADLRFRHNVAPQPADYQGTSLSALINEGRIAINVNIQTAMDNVKRVEGLKWDIYPVSRGTAGRVTRMAGASTAVHPGSKNKQTAYEFAKFSGSYEQFELNKNTAALPVVKRAAEASWYLGWVTPEIKKLWLETNDYGRTQAHHLKWQDIMEGDGARKFYTEALDGKRSVPDAMEQIRRHAAAILGT